MNYDFNDINFKQDELNTIKGARKKLLESKDEGSDYLGWRKSYSKYLTSNEIEDLKDTAKDIRKKSDVLIVLGIGGSYLGSKAVISSVLGEHYNENSDMRIYFGGNNISAENYAFLEKIINSNDVSVIVISKSGKTLETMLGFELVLEMMQAKYALDMFERIYAITDVNTGILRDFANRHAIKSFIVPNDVGGRYSIFTPVGLLPLAAMGIDIDSFLLGAANMQSDLNTESFDDNPAMKYAAARYHLYKQGFATEILLTYSPANVFFAEWWKQLFGESEGKCGKGLLPNSMTLTTDLHSLGQYLQDGKKTFFETHLFTEKHIECNKIGKMNCSGFKKELGLEHIEGLSFCDMNRIAHDAVLKAHRYSGNINLCVRSKENSPYEMGALMYFFMESCAISAYALEVNPFNQNGVERYKSNMRDLMG